MQNILYELQDCTLLDQGLIKDEEKIRKSKKGSKRVKFVRSARYPVLEERLHGEYNTVEQLIIVITLALLLHTYGQELLWTGIDRYYYVLWTRITMNVCEPSPFCRLCRLESPDTWAAGSAAGVRCCLRLKLEAYTMVGLAPRIGSAGELQRLPGGPLGMYLPERNGQTQSIN